MAATMTSCAKLNVKSVYQILKQCHRTASHSQVQKHACQFDLVLNSHHVLRSPHFTYCRRFYCQKQNAETGDITASILQSRIGAEQNRQNTDNTSKDQKSEEQPKKEKKGFTMFGRFISWQSAGMGSFFIMMSGTLTLMVASWGPPERDDTGKPIEDEYSDYPWVIAYVKRTWGEIFHQVKVTQEPSRQKLLPDPLTYPYIQPPYTLVLELIDVLVHPEWNMATGWRFKKRPGIDHFLRAIGPPMFEVVIYTKESGMTADPIITKIDPENYVMYRLYKDATRYENGTHIKDLNYLNRDLSKVIFIDWDEKAFHSNPENAFKVKQWKGENEDVLLGELADFLRAMAASKVDDVRPVLQYYNQFEDPIDQFHKNQAKLREEQEKMKMAVVQREKKNLTGSIVSKYLK